MTSPNGTSAVVDAAAVDAADSTERRVTSFTLETGIVLRLKPVPLMALNAAAARVPRPAVPVVMIPEKGREEPNPNDPAYQQAIEDWAIDQTEAQLAVALLLGTEIESVPEGMWGPDDDEWIDEAQEVQQLAGNADFAIHREGRARYLDWLRMYAITSIIDRDSLRRLLTLGYAITEREVQRAAETFRRVLGGPAYFGDTPPERAPVGDTDHLDDAGPTA